MGWFTPKAKTPPPDTQDASDSEESFVWVYGDLAEETARLDATRTGQEGTQS